MSSQTNRPTQSRQAINWTFGLDFTYDNARYAWRRQGYASKLVVGSVDDALGRGFNIVEMNTETRKKTPIVKNDEAMDIIMALWLDIKKTIYYDRAYGKGLGMFWQDEINLPFFRAYDRYQTEYNEFGKATFHQITNRIGGTAAIAELDTIMEKELDFAYELIIREDDIKGEGISILEAPWDTLYSLAQLDEQGTYYAIRYGAGIRYMKIPEAKFKDTVFMAKIMSMLKGAIGSNGVYALPYNTVGGVKEEFEILSESAVQINFLQLRDLLLGTLSGQTGIPREIFLGSQIGLRSSEKNEDSYFDYLQNIQRQYKPFLKWIVNMLNSFYKWFGNDTTIDIEYLVRDTMTVEERTELLGKKVDIANKAGYSIPMKWLGEQLEIKLEEKEIDPLGINAAIGEKKKGEEDNEDNTKTTGKDDGEEEDDEEDDDE